MIFVASWRSIHPQEMRLESPKDDLRQLGFELQVHSHMTFALSCMIPPAPLCVDRSINRLQTDNFRGQLHYIRRFAYLRTKIV
jgi:hypothetical protein